MFIGFKIEDKNEKNKDGRHNSHLGIWIGPIWAILEKGTLVIILIKFQEFLASSFREDAVLIKSLRQVEDGNQTSKDGSLAAILDYQSAPFEET